MISVLDQVRSEVDSCLSKKDKFSSIYERIKGYLSLLTEEDFTSLVDYYNNFVQLTSVFFSFIAIKYLNTKSIDYFKNYIIHISKKSSFFFLSSAAIYSVINGGLKPLPAFYKKFLRFHCLTFKETSITVNHYKFLDIVKLTHPKVCDESQAASLKAITINPITNYRFI